jgi:Fe-S oxidoreductase
MVDPKPVIDPSFLFSGPDAPEEADLYKCVHCGFCLQACPTYLETGLETESPRGRIALMKAVNEGRIGMTDSVVRHWDLCIQCRACEVACPSGVPYGSLIEATMAQVERKRQVGIIPRLAAGLALNHIVPNQRRLEFTVGLARVYQKSGIQTLVRKSGLLRLVSRSIADMEGSMPSVSDRFFRARGQTSHPQGAVRSRVALLSGCVMPLFSGPEMEAVVRVLNRNGCEVVVPEGQVCCGAIHSHVGDLETTRAMARRNIDVFADAGVDAVVVASAGCGSRMKEYDHLLKDDAQYSEKAIRFVHTVKDIHEFLVDLPFTPPTAELEYRVTYQDSCHLGNAQRITSAPRHILNSIPGVDFVELPGAGRCCGAGGTYTITERDFSLRVLGSKMDDFETTGADVLATANPGCLLQLQYGIGDRGLSADVKYVTDLLDEAYRLEDTSR